MKLKVLAIDTAAIVATACVMDDDKLIAEHISNHKKTHSQTIMPMIKNLLDSVELKADDIDCFASAIGPGSFTGIRIGVATVKGLAHALEKPIVGVSTLAGLAYNVPFSEFDIYPIMDARRDQVYNGVYSFKGERLNCIKDDRAISIEDVIDEVFEGGKKVLFLGDGVHVHKRRLETTLGELALFVPNHCNMHRASSIAQLAMYKIYLGETQSYLDFAPSYLRKSQAEREAEYTKTC